MRLFFFFFFFFFLLILLALPVTPSASYEASGIVHLCGGR